MKAEKIQITSEFIRLDSLLKLSGCVESGGQAKWLIQNEKILVNGDVCTQRGKKLHTGDTVQFEGQLFEVEKEE